MVAVPPLVARKADGRTEATPSMVVIDTHRARGASGGFTFHDGAAPTVAPGGVKRVVDVAGLPVAAVVVPASAQENRASELMLEHVARQGVTGRLGLVLGDRGVTEAAARTLGRHHGSGSAGSGGTTGSRSSAPSGTPGASSEVGHGRLGRSRA